LSDGWEQAAQSASSKYSAGAFAAICGGRSGLHGGGTDGCQSQYGDPVFSQAARGHRGALFDGGKQLSALIGRSTTPLSASVAAALA